MKFLYGLNFSVGRTYSFSITYSLNISNSTSYRAMPSPTTPDQLGGMNSVKRVLMQGYWTVIDQ